MRPNSTKLALAAGRIVLGTQIQQYGTPEVARTLAAAGVDFIWVDAEHSPFDHETVHGLVRAAAAAGPTPLVRVGEFAYTLVARALDSGAQGVILPRATDVEVVREALGWMRFPPQGTRGYGLSGPHLEYRRATIDQVIEHANTHTLGVVQFETAWAIDHCDELLALEGLDVALVGPGDLSIALGVPGQFDHPTLVEAVARVIDGCRRHGVAPGIHVVSAALAPAWIARGMRFVSAGGDHVFLLERATEAVSALREAAEPAEHPARSANAPYPGTR